MPGGFIETGSCIKSQSLRNKEGMYAQQENNMA